MNKLNCLFTWPWMRAALLATLTLLVSSAVARGENVVFPADAIHVVNVKQKYGARGDGKTDDTQALQNAIRDNVDTHRILYLPNGVYRVNDRLSWRRAPQGDDGYANDPHAGWGAWLRLQGQSRVGTVIRLINRAPGFGDPARPKAVVYTASCDDQQFHGNPYDDATGPGNQAFGNYVCNLTVETGAGNPGAIGVDYQVSNYGALRDVTIRGSGVVGLFCARRDNGPGLIKNVSVEGFAVGVQTGGAVSNLVFEHLGLRGQTQAGLRNTHLPLQIRDLRSDNAVPVVQNRGAEAHLVLVGGVFSGGKAGAAAIENEGHLFARDVRTSGYARALRSHGTNVFGATITEFVSDKPLALFPASAAAPSLRLPVRETPDATNDPLTLWQSVGPSNNGDDTAAIQAAMNRNKPTVYFPGGNLRVSGTITVPPTVRRIVGLESQISRAEKHTFGDNKPLFRFLNATAKNTTVVEGFTLAVEGSTLFAHDDARTLVLRDIGSFGGQAYRPTEAAAAAAGDLFVENVAAAPWTFAPGQRVWARQLNPEGGREVVRNNGATVWILGLKTEGRPIILYARNNGATELLGGQLYPAGPVPLDTPAFIIENARATLVIAGSSFAAPNFYSVLVRETRGGAAQTRELRRADVPARGGGGIVLPQFNSAGP